MIETFSNLIDSTEEEFIAFCNDQPLGYLMSLNTLLASTYWQINDNVLNPLIKQAKDKAGDKEINLFDNSEETETIRGVVSKMMLIELKCAKLKEIINSRSITEN